MQIHPFTKFRFCPCCGSTRFAVHDSKSKQCADCSFTYYYNAAAAVVAIVLNERDELLVCRRVNDPAKDTLDLPGGFVDAGENAEESLRREVREETGLALSSVEYLFSFPNEYLFSDFMVYTCDMFFFCRAADSTLLTSGDDAADCRFIPRSAVKPADFGLQSIRQGITEFCQDKYQTLPEMRNTPAPAMNDNAFELLPCVDEDGHAIGLATRGILHGGSRLLHPVVHLHVFNERGELYLQKRPTWKDIQPDKWDTAVGGHVDPGETPEQAVQREAEEELTLRDYELYFQQSYIFESDREREMIYVFYARLNKGTMPIPSAELADGRFFSIDEIKERMDTNFFTPNFEQEFHRLQIEQWA